MNLTHKDYFNIAFPFIISTITQPLLGAVDTAVIGKLGIAELIGGVAIGAVVMNTLYWLFGFFRVSTTSQSAIAFGKEDNAAKANSLFRPFALALLVGLIFIALQSVIWQGANHLIAPESSVSQHAKIYFDIMIYGAPFVLLNYTLIGWLMGQAKAKATLFIQVMGNVLNIILDIIFVLYFDMGVAGVAIATLIAQTATFLLGLIFVFVGCDFPLLSQLKKTKIGLKDLGTIMSSNMDLLLRTACLLIFFNMMARSGSKLGSNILATNAILMQITFIISYFFDGVANASSVFAGKAVGQKNPDLLSRVIKLNWQWTGLFIAIMTLILVLFKQDMVRLFTASPELIQLYEATSLWLVFFPLVAGFGLTFYGIFTGTGTTRPVRNSTFFTLLVFLSIQFLTLESMGNQGLWLAFTLFYLGRFVFLYPFIFQVKQKCSTKSAF